MSEVIEKYLTKIREVVSKPGAYAYRGQDNASWPLHSGATRRLVDAYGTELLQDPYFLQIYISYHRDTLLEPSRTQGFGIEGGHIVSDLQLLAKLQHFGAATGLLDFTWNPSIALWFACQSDAHDGKLFIVNTNDTIRLAKVSSNENEQTVENIFSRIDNLPTLSYWEPMLSGDAMSRILRQRSVFIIGRPLIPKDPKIVAEIEISKADKTAILEDLQLLDTSRASLFQDVYGFSQAESASSALQQIKDPQWYLIQANRFYQRGDYSEAIHSYDECIDLNPSVGAPYFFRGNAKSASGQYADAIQDYTQAISRKDHLLVGSDLHMVYFNRGNTRSELSDFEGALSDYGESIRLAPHSRASFFNRGNAYMDLCQLEESIDEYDRAIALGYDDALFNKSNALVMIGRFGEALECYRLLEERAINSDGTTQNRISLENLIEKIGSSEYKARLKTNSNYGGLIHLEVCIENDEDGNFWNIIFKGRIGNIGSFGWKGLPGGRGAKGKLGFIVTVGTGSRGVQ